MTALDLPWEEASHLLKHAAGDLSAAFKNELSAYHLNEKLLDELVWEYAAHRFVAHDSALVLRSCECGGQVPSAYAATIHRIFVQGMAVPPSSSLLC